MHGFGAFGLLSSYGELRVAVPLSDGRWLSFVTSLPQDSPVLSRQLLVAMALMALITLFVSAWVVRSVTKPLANLASAAQRLEVDLAAPPLSETGTIETRQAARAGPLDEGGIDARFGHGSSFLANQRAANIGTDAPIGTECRNKFGNRMHIAAFKRVRHPAP